MRIGEKFSERLKAARERRNLSQIELASAMGVGKGTVGNWETGQTPNVSTVEKIAAFFGVSLGWLLGEDDEPIALKENPSPYRVTAPVLPPPALNPLDDMSTEELMSKVDALVKQGNYRRLKPWADELARRSVNSTGAEEKALEKEIDVVEKVTADAIQAALKQTSGGAKARRKARPAPHHPAA